MMLVLMGLRWVKPDRRGVPQIEISPPSRKEPVLSEVEGKGDGGMVQEAVERPQVRAGIDTRETAEGTKS